MELYLVIIFAIILLIAPLGFFDTAKGKVMFWAVTAFQICLFASWLIRLLLEVN